METTNRKPGNFNEVVFENRNRQYGAYVIRRDYSDSVTKSFFIALTGMMLAIGIPLAIQLMSVVAEVKPPDTGPVLGTVNAIIDIKLPDNKQADKAKEPRKNASGPPVIKNDPEKKEEPKKDPDPNPNGNGKGKDTLGPTGGTPGGKGLEPRKDSIKEPDVPVVYTEFPPEFPGGEKALLKYFSDNMRYPREAVESGIQGSVVLTFVIGKDGRVTDVIPLKKLSGGCTEAAISAAKGMPAWQPGRNKAGKPVMVQYNLPVSFRLK